MDITISVSKKAEANIRKAADRSGKDVINIVEEIVEEKFASGNGEQRQRMHNLLAFAGKYKSNRTDTSERMSEILRETNFDPAEGFSIK